jgi:hypothetical protein
MTRHVERDLPKLVGSLTLMLPGLVFRFGIQAFWFKHKAYRAARIFRRELSRQGLDSTITQRLTDSYLEGSDPFKLLRALR